MSKLRKLQAQDDEELQMDMSPMIDMVFLLLIFFIVAAKIIKIKQVPDITVPIAKKGSREQEDIMGRIVINVYTDGTITDINGKGSQGKLLASPEEIAEYVRERAEKVKDQGYDPEIHLRADRDVEFRDVRKVVKAAAEGGVIKVIFASTKRYADQSLNR